MNKLFFLFCYSKKCLNFSLFLKIINFLAVLFTVKLDLNTTSEYQQLQATF